MCLTCHHPSIHARRRPQHRLYTLRPLDASPPSPDALPLPTRRRAGRRCSARRARPSVSPSTMPAPSATPAAPTISAAMGGITSARGQTTGARSWRVICVIRGISVTPYTQISPVGSAQNRSAGHVVRIFCGAPCPHTAPASLRTLSVTSGYFEICSGMAHLPTPVDGCKATSIGRAGEGDSVALGVRHVDGEAGDGHHEVEVAAERVDPAHVAGHEGGPLVVGQVEVRDEARRIREEALAVGALLLEPVEQAVDGVAAHASLHSTAARLMRPSSPK